MNEEDKKEMIELKSLAKVAGAIVATLTLMAGGFSWLSYEFLRKETFQGYQESVTRQQARLEEKIAEVIRVIEDDRSRNENELRQMIRDGSALGIVVRRDFLLSRGDENLTSAERAELNFLNSKIRQLNLE